MRRSFPIDLAVAARNRGGTDIFSHFDTPASFACAAAELQRGRYLAYYSTLSLFLFESLPFCAIVGAKAFLSSRDWRCDHRYLPALQI